MMDAGINWLKKCQKPDGGWGEGLLTYIEGEGAGFADSTPTQTAWALMGLLTRLPPTDEAVVRGVRFLRETQIVDGEKGWWKEMQHTGTGFPGHFYLHYDYYRHYFPLMALGRYKQAGGDIES